MKRSSSIFIIFILTLISSSLFLSCNAEAPSNSKTVLASGQFGPWGIALDSDCIYWTNRGDGKIIKVLKEGGEVVVLAERGVGSAPTGIAVDNTTVYWAERTAKKVCKVSKEGGTVVELATGLGGPFGVAVDDEYVYWTEHDSGRLQKIPKEGGENITLASGLAGPPASNGYYLLTLDNEYVYWTERSGSGYGRVLKVSKEGGIIYELATRLVGLIGVTIDDTYVYWSESTDLTGGPDCGRICKVSKKGGETILLARRQNSPLGIAVDDTYLYWGENIFRGGIRAIEKSRTDKMVDLGAELKMVDLAVELNKVFSIAVDDRYVYWADYAEGTISKSLHMIGTIMSVTLQPTDVQIGHSVTITAKLTDKKGSAVADASIDFHIFINDEWKRIGSSITDPDGLSSIIYIANISSGTYSIKASYAGNQTYSEVSSPEVYLTVNAKRDEYITNGTIILTLIAFGVIVFTAVKNHYGVGSNFNFHELLKFRGWLTQKWLYLCLCLIGLILATLTLASFYLPWAVGFGRKGFVYTPEAHPPIIFFHGYTLPFPNNFLVIISGGVLLLFSIISVKLNNIIYGATLISSGLALIPPILSAFSLNSASTVHSLAAGFYLAAISSICSITVGASIIVIRLCHKPSEVSR